MDVTPYSNMLVGAANEPSFTKRQKDLELLPHNPKVELVCASSLDPSKLILPPLAESNVGPLVKVPSLLPTKSDQVVPDPGYDLLFPAST